MSQKKNPGWATEFAEFLDSPEASPPAQISETLLARIYRSLNPPQWMVLAKLGAVHTSVGLLSLGICPQFGMGNTHHSGFMSFFMNFGDVACQIACGALFLGLSLLVASFFLRPEEVKVIRKNRLTQIALLMGLSLGAFVCAGSEVFSTLTLAWVFGALVASLASLELGWLVRRALKRAYRFSA
jgi:hypothetical protein